MTSEEAICNLNMISVAFVEPVTKDQRKLINDTFDVAFKALKRESGLDVLDKIIAEIEEYSLLTRERVIGIIDKYRREQE